MIRFTVEITEFRLDWGELFTNDVDDEMYDWIMALIETRGDEAYRPSIPDGDFAMFEIIRDVFEEVELLEHIQWESVDGRVY